MYQQPSFEVFQRYFKKDTKAWLSPVKLIYSHSFLHNIVSNRSGFTENNFSNFCAIINENKEEMFRF